MATTKELTARIEVLEARLDKAAEMHKALHQLTKAAFQALEERIPAQLEASLTSALSQMMAQHQATMQRGASQRMQPRTDFFMKALHQLREERGLTPRAHVPLDDIKARMQVLKAAAESHTEPDSADAFLADVDAPM